MGSKGGAPAPAMLVVNKKSTSEAIERHRRYVEKENSRYDDTAGTLVVVLVVAAIVGVIGIIVTVPSHDHSQCVKQKQAECIKWERRTVTQYLPMSMSFGTLGVGNYRNVIENVCVERKGDVK